LAGGIGSLAGTPCDLALVRMQADSTLPEAQRRNYKNVFHAFATIVRTEGLLSCWKGATPTVVRAMALNLGMLTSYDMVKENMEKREYSKNQAWVGASLVSGAVASTVSLPFDNVKTKL
jgi:solute carrier family 25 oxoglutarate transporter 11